MDYEELKRKSEEMSRTFPRDPDKHVEPPELTPADEEALDAAWANRRKSPDQTRDTEAA